MGEVGSGAAPQGVKLRGWTHVVRNGLHDRLPRGAGDKTQLATLVFATDEHSRATVFLGPPRRWSRAPGWVLGGAAPRLPLPRLLSGIAGVLFIVLGLDALADLDAQRVADEHRAGRPG
jgi:hypothetical protein